MIILKPANVPVEFQTLFSKMAAKARRLYWGLLVCYFAQALNIFLKMLIRVEFCPHLSNVV